jgi:DNA-binding transcriptional MocR family regulator
MTRSADRAKPGLGLALDPQADEPVYRQIFDALAHRIREGTLPGGFRLPPTRSLAVEIGTHRNTVARAYADLEQAGLISATVGRGTFVNEKLPKAAPAEAPVRPPLPWASLTARNVNAEPLVRADRFARPAPGRDVIDLTRMQPAEELLPHDLFGRALQHVLRTRGSRSLGYAPREGVPRLREQIAKDLERQGVPARAEDILVTSGSQQALDLVGRVLADPGETVAAQGTTYGGALRLFAALGLRVSAVPEDAHGPTIAGLRSSSRPRFVYLMPNHHNPTGREIPFDRRSELVEWSHESGVPLIEDDYASDLLLDETLPPVPMRAMSADVIYIGTYSKKLIPALRIGYLVCPPRLHPHVTNLKHAMDLGSSSLLQHALAEFLERDYLVAHLRRVQQAYRERRDALVSALKRELPSAARFDVPKRGVSIWLELPPDISPEALYEEALHQGVLVSPSTLHRVEGGEARAVRFNYCVEPVDRLKEGAKRLGRAFDALSKRERREQGTQISVI